MDDMIHEGETISLKEDTAKSNTDIDTKNDEENKEQDCSNEQSHGVDNEEKKSPDESDDVEEGEIKSSPQPLEKTNSTKKRGLECAGNVEEKCHPNPKAKRCKLQDILNDNSSTKENSSSYSSESIPVATAQSTTTTYQQGTSPLPTSSPTPVMDFSQMYMNSGMAGMYAQPSMGMYQQSQQSAVTPDNSSSYYTMNAMDPATFNYCMQFMMQMMQNPMFMQQMQQMMANPSQQQMMQMMMQSQQVMGAPVQQQQMMDPAMQNMVNSIMSASVAPPEPPSPPASLVTIPQRRPEDFTDDPVDECKLFVGGMPCEVTEAILRQYFQQFGPVRSVTVVKNRDTGISRGFGFVTFVSKISMEDVLRIPKHEFFGKKVDMHKCTPNNRDNSNQGEPTQYKVFVGSLDESITEEMLRDSLGMYGQVCKVNIIRNNEGRSRGFAFVHFTEQTPVDMLIKRQHMNINGRKVAFGSANSKKKNASSSQKNSPN